MSFDLILISSGTWVPEITEKNSVGEKEWEREAVFNKQMNANTHARTVQNTFRPEKTRFLLWIRNCVICVYTSYTQRSDGVWAESRRKDEKTEWQMKINDGRGDNNNSQPAEADDEERNRHEIIKWIFFSHFLLFICYSVVCRVCVFVFIRFIQCFPSYIVSSSLFLFHFFLSSPHTNIDGSSCQDFSRARI